MIATVVTHQLLSLRRQRFFATAIGVLVGVTVLAGILGWASHQTIIGVYDESVKLLATRGQSAPPNPFLLKPVLSMLSNMIIYITMIGALVAIVLGHLTVADDETNGIGRLVFTRPIARTHYAAGKLAAAGIVLMLAIAACFAISVAALAVVNKTFPGGSDLLRLIGFYALSWLYLMVFVAVGAVAMLVTRRRSLGLLAAIGVWLVVTFVVPQFTSGLRPAQSLNPIVDPVSTSQTFFKFTSNARPYSIAEQYKAAAGRVLQTTAFEPTGDTLWRVAPVAAALVLLALSMARLIARHDYSRSHPE
jgi:ABC-type transport system involved in multi-copper enzyme maturation permease subunit